MSNVDLLKKVVVAAERNLGTTNETDLVDFFVDIIPEFQEDNEDLSSCLGITSAFDAAHAQFTEDDGEEDEVEEEEDEKEVDTDGDEGSDPQT